MVRGCNITSFISGMVVSFLPPLMLFVHSVVLSTVPAPTAELFTLLLLEALPAVRRVKLLFCSSRDGATAASFHRCCDRQGPTLTLIRDVANNVFGGYTGVEWVSEHVWLNDPAAFLFTVLNPHGDPPVLFASTADGYSLYCHLLCGPAFGGLWVSGQFDRCGSYIGHGGYVNTSRHSGYTVLTGALCFVPANVETWGLE